MTIDEAIKHIKEFGLYHAIKDIPHSALTVEAFEMAISSLRAEQASGKLQPQPLTLDELRQMNGQPIWISDLMDGKIECLRFDCIKPATYHTGDDCRFEQFGTSTGIIRWECKYGETWLAYLYPPKEATHAAESNS